MRDYYRTKTAPRVSGFRLAARISMALLLCAAALGALLSCKLPMGQDATGLTVVIGASAAKTLVPNVDMNAASYSISGSGPNGATFSTTLSSGTSTTIPRCRLREHGR